MPVLCFSEPCLCRPALLSASPVQFTAPQNRAAAIHCPSELCRCSAPDCFAPASHYCSLLFQCKSEPFTAGASQGFALPLPLRSIQCRSYSDLCSALPPLVLSVPCLCLSTHRFASATHSTSFPPQRFSVQCRRSAVSASAQPLPCKSAFAAVPPLAQPVELAIVQPLADHRLI